MTTFEGRDGRQTPPTELVEVPQWHNPFEALVLERFGEEGADLRPVTVITIDGLRGAGVSSASLAFAELFRQTHSSQPVIVSYEQALLEEQEFYAREEIPVEAHRSIDRRIAEQMLSPDNSGRLVIVEGGSHMAIIAGYIRAAGLDLVAEGAIPEFPVHLMTTFIFGDEDVRSLRREDAEIERDELEKVWEIYPELEGQNIFGINSLLREQGVYNLFYDTEGETSASIAVNMLNSSSFQEQVLQYIPPTQTV